MLDLLATYLMADRIGCALAIATIVMVFASANHVWRRARPPRKTLNG